MPSQTDAGIARRVQAGVNCRNPFKLRWNLGDFFDQKRLNDGNDPSRQPETVNHGDAEILGQSNRSTPQPGAPLISTGSAKRSARSITYLRIVPRAV